MYFGSVRFFKHLILSLVFLAVVVPTVTATFLFVKNQGLSAKLNTYISKDSHVGFASVSSGKDQSNLFKFPGYSSMYPDLQVPFKAINNQQQEKIAYLTFDDGPSEVTESVLAVLNKYNIKATFLL